MTWSLSWVHANLVQPGFLSEKPNPNNMEKEGHFTSLGFILKKITKLGSIRNYLPSRGVFCHDGAKSLTFLISFLFSVLSYSPALSFLRVRSEISSPPSSPSRSLRRNGLLPSIQRLAHKLKISCCTLPNPHPRLLVAAQTRGCFVSFLIRSLGPGAEHLAGGRDRSLEGMVRGEKLGGDATQTMAEEFRELPVDETGVRVAGEAGLDGLEVEEGGGVGGGGGKDGGGEADGRG